VGEIPRPSSNSRQRNKFVSITIKKRPICVSALAYQLGFVVGTVYRYEK